MSNEVNSASIEAGEVIPPKTNDAGTSLPTRPDTIPEKFWDAEKGQVRAEDLAKSYTELEKKLSPKPNAAPKDEPKTTDAGTNLGITPEQVAQQKVADAGIDFNALQQEYNEKGQLSEETYKKLEAAKLPKTLVDGYIEGQKAIAVKTQNEVFEAIGGKETYSQALEWAKTNLDPAEIAAYDRSLKGKSIDEIKVQAKGLVARFKAEAHSNPNLVLGGNATAGITPYANMNDLVKDQRKPEYRSDPAFREKVKARLAISTNI